MSNKTVFSKMVDGTLQVPFISETENTFTILDKNPLTNGHCLVITKEQIDHLDDCSDELYQEVFKEVHKLSRMMKLKLKPKRIGIVVHGFEIPHAHIHVVPLYTGKELQLAAKEREKLEDIDNTTLFELLTL